MPTDFPMIQFRNITKRFPGVQALNEVSFEIEAGSCHAVVGENGAGKSTLGKILAGIYPPDGGEILIDGQAARFTGPRDALEAKIGIVHQELAFCENLTVAENLCLGDLPSQGTFLSRSRMTERAQELLSAIDTEIDVDHCIGDLTVARQQMVQIAASIGSGARVIIFDEPTSSLSHVETARLFELVARLKSQGVTCIYISHDMEDVFLHCDTVTVLRDGQHVATQPVSALDQDGLISLMIGRSLNAYFPSHIETDPGEELLRVERLSSPGKFENLSFRVRAGEVVGLAGLVGAGRTEAAQSIFGLDPMTTGRICIEGKPVRIRHPADAMKSGMGFVPEDRKRFGLVLSMRVHENITLPTIERLSRYGWIRSQQEAAVSRDYVDQLRIRTAGLSAATAGLSGGNQQKLVLARWLAARCRILVVDEPTRGVDVGAKAEMHALLDRLADEGSGILLISSELPEILNLSTRVLVLRDGRLVGELSHEEADQDRVMRLMTGVSPT